MKKYSISPINIYFNSWRSFLSWNIWAENLKDLYKECKQVGLYLDENLNFEALEKELEKNGEVFIGEFRIRAVEGELR